MRRSILPALALLLSSVVSCSDMPTAPKIPPAPPGDVNVEGVIRDRDGPVLANTTLTFRHFPVSASQPSPAFRAATDLNGAFRIALAQGPYDVRISPDYESGLPPVTIPKFEVKGGSRLDYRYSGTRVAGDVTGPGGASLSDATIYAISTEVGVSVRAVNGHYSMLLPPGEYDFYSDSGLYESGIPSIEVEANISASDTLIHFALTGHVVTVTATLGAGTPLPNVQIYAESNPIGVRAVAHSRLDGTATLYLPSGGYSFNAYSYESGIVGPETGYWSISGDASIPVDFPGTRWDVTLRRTSDGAALPFASIIADEIGTFRHASTSSDIYGKFRLFVQPNAGYDLQIGSPNFGASTIVVPNVSSTADSTFDLYVDVPVP
jgi:hypothetical protein